MTSILIKNGCVWQPDAADKLWKTADLLIQGEQIKAVEPNLPIDPCSVEQVVDATDKLVLPGFVNAHLHAGECLTRGIVAGLPNELWNLWSYPPLQSAPMGARLLYLRTAVDAVEMIKGGITTVQDHSREWFLSGESEAEEAYFAAYLDSGMRLSLAINLINRPWQDVFPELAHLLPPALLTAMLAESSHWRIDPVDEIMQLCERTIRRWNGSFGRFSVALGPSAPQRCTEELLRRLASLAQEQQLPIHTHLLETHIQTELSRRHPSGSFVRYLDTLGLLGPRTTVAHAIWLSDDDIHRLGDSGCCVVHNPVCNLCLGSGIMPFARLSDAGARFALGLDGASSAGRLSMFEVMKTTALLHTAATPDYRRWPTPQQVLHMATQGGAFSIGQESQLGTLAPGKLADIILLDLNTPAFTPRNDLCRQLVYSEDGSSVNTVIIHGKIVMQNYQLTTLDEAALLAEFRGAWSEFQADHQRAVAASQGLLPALRQIHRTAAGLDKTK